MTYGGAPPCTTCKKPSSLFPENRLVYKIWEICNAHREVYLGTTSATPKRLKIEALVDICGAYNGTQIEFEKIINVEAVVFPLLQTSYQKEAPNARN